MEVDWGDFEAGQKQDLNLKTAEGLTMRTLNTFGAETQTTQKMGRCVRLCFFGLLGINLTLNRNGCIYTLWLKHKYRSLITYTKK